MSTDAGRWASARNLRELAALCIAWLDGEISETPIYEGAPCEDKLSLALVLRLVNRAGFVTDNAARAGVDESGEDQWGAWVEGFADDETLTRLTDAIAGPGVLTLSAVRRYSPQHEDVSQTWDAWTDACPMARSALLGAWYVVIEDPRPGRDSVLWPALEAFAASAVTA
jgi:hypothetical protein